MLATVPRFARYLVFSLAPVAGHRDALKCFGDITNGGNPVVGIGGSALLGLGKTVKGSLFFPSKMVIGFDVPSTPGALWCWLGGDDWGELVIKTRLVTHTISAAFRLDKVIEAFQYAGSRDLTGYEDGTENPKGNKSFDAATISGHGNGLDGSSVVPFSNGFITLIILSQCRVKSQITPSDVEKAKIKKLQKALRLRTSNGQRGRVSSPRPLF
jgi:putative iron-dependent peroxidase